MPYKREITKKEEQNDNLFFQKLISENPTPQLGATDSEGELLVDVYETKKDIMIKAAIAGIKLDDLQIFLHNDILTIQGLRKEEESNQKRHYLCKECHWGRFSRSIILPDNVKTDKIKAQLQRGVLSINLPKAKKEASIKVEELDD